MLVFFLCSSIFCAIPFQDKAGRESDVAAVIGGYEITEGRVERHLNKTLPHRFQGKYSNVFKREALEHLINRHLVLVHIESQKSKASKSELKFEMSKLTDRLNEIDKDLTDFLSEQKISEKELMYEFRWRLAWRKYLKRKLSDENLKQFYEQNSRKYDGTRVRISHILLLEKDGANEERAFTIREKISMGEISWRDAVVKYSAAESSKMAGGDVGWIDFFGPMTPVFCQQCIGLGKNELSKPFRTKFGWHVAKCTDVKRGQSDFGDVKPVVREDATKFLFFKLAKMKRETVEVSFFADWVSKEMVDVQK